MNDAADQNLRELAAAYALGALGPEEARAFEAWLAANPEARREVAEYQEVGALLALAARDAGVPSPAADLKRRTIERATANRNFALPNRSRWAPWIALAASLLAVVGLGLQQRTLRRELGARDSAIARLQQSLAARAETLALREAELNAILDPAVSLTRLASTQTPEPGIQLFWNHRTNIVFLHAFHLKPAANQRVYQLWFIPKGGKPIPSVTFNSEPDGHGVVQGIPVPEPSEFTAAAITDEPEGGSPQPTTPVVLVGVFATVKS